MNSLDNEIILFKQNVNTYEKIYNSINSKGTISRQDVNYLLTLKKNLLQTAKQILNNINNMENSTITAAGITNVNTSNKLMRNKSDIYNLIEIMETNDIEDQLQIQTNLEGSLEDSILRYDAINIEYLLYTILAVIVISLLVV